MALYPISLAPGMTLPCGVEVHVTSRGSWCLLAIVKEVSLAIRHADKHESAAADISGGGMHHREGESGSDGGVDGVASGLQDVGPYLRRDRVHGDDHAVLGVHGMGRAEDTRRGDEADGSRENQ